jgi:hypothetical protein
LLLTLLLLSSPMAAATDELLPLPPPPSSSFHNGRVVLHLGLPPLQLQPPLSLTFLVLPRAIGGIPPP